MLSPTIRPITDADREWMRQFIIDHWSGEDMVAYGQLFRPHEHDGFAAFDGDAVVGLVTYRIERAECEVLSLDSLRERQGIGTTLMNAVIQQANSHACTRIWLVTTNDNLNALAFYQKRGFVISAVRLNALAETRKHKPNIPLVAENGIPIRDEIEMELRL